MKDSAVVARRGGYLTVPNLIRRRAGGPATRKFVISVHLTNSNRIVSAAFVNSGRNDYASQDK